MPKIKITLDGINSRSDTMEEKFSKYKNRGKNSPKRNRVGGEITSVSYGDEFKQLNIYIHM